MTETDSRYFSCGYMGDAIGNLPRVIENASETLVDVDFDTIVGTGFSGSIVIPMLATALGKHFVLIRKEGDDSHHGGGRLLGTLGKRWIFVDDFTSMGKTYDRVMHKIGEAETGSGPLDPPFETTHVGAYFYVPDVFRSAKEA